MNELTNKLSEEFSDMEYAHSYMEAHSVTRISAQIYALRKQRGWSQEELSIESGIAQERISKIESADFDSLTIKTLRKFAHAFDINLKITFQTFSEGILDLVNLNAKKMEAESRELDLQRFKSAPLKIDIDGDIYKHNNKKIGVVLTVPMATPIIESKNKNGWQRIGEAHYG